MNEDQMIEILNHRASLTPVTGMAGVFYRDAPASAALGGGYGQFLWFENMPDLLAFLRDHAHDMNLGMGPMYMEHDRLREQAAAFTERAIQGELLIPALLTQLNIALEGFVEIEWLGLFEDLILDQGPFAAAVRGAFKESSGLAVVNDASLGNDEIADFVDFLGSYGV